MKKGFTLIEIIIVLVLIGILVSIISPIYRSAVIRAREAVLKENLFQVRDAIGKYYNDKHKYPTSLDDLVTYKYLRKIPDDPVSKVAEWEVVHFEPGEDMEDFDSEILEGIIDVKSRSPKKALDGTNYSDW
jgi:general secretion pathway protein G